MASGVPARAPSVGVRCLPTEHLGAAVAACTQIGPTHTLLGGGQHRRSANSLGHGSMGVDGYSSLLDVYRTMCVGRKQRTSRSRSMTSMKQCIEEAEVSLSPSPRQRLDR
jgi:hypothetical protein